MEETQVSGTFFFTGKRGFQETRISKVKICNVRICKVRICKAKICKPKNCEIKISKTKIKNLKTAVMYYANQATQIAAQSTYKRYGKRSKAKQ